MPTQLTNYKCPACTGPLHFDGASGQLKCDYCDSVFSVEEVEKLYREDEAAAAEAFEEKQEDKGAWDASQLEENWQEEGLVVYSCPSCGAELICEKTTAATSCPYCNNPTIVPGQLSGTLKPDYVIPFKLDKKAAIAALEKFYRGKWFLPKEFKNKNKIAEIKGIYVPFWLFDGQAEADVILRPPGATPTARETTE